ncbi:hypothetical protein AC579_695 [Pseudocercospora musae]|uniref:FAD/NAD(P)-binding domain-containing protein n=1 Tax=Pseudocercospora musae TaxID=113226 RepID=A0A139ICQ3_9PEZI|nr:hypothetical protein AC579_695 [Pseudocercospora musae]
MAYDEQYEVVVIGAGICGLSAAKGYLQCAPQTNLRIIDERQQNNRWHFPFSEKYGISYGEHVTGEAMYQYLCDYADHLRLRLQTKVTEVEKLEGKNAGWKISVQTLKGKSSLFTEKLIVSAGLTSKPLRMTLPGQESYAAPHLHAGSLAREVPQLASDPKVERVTIYGGSKFAWGSVYAFASRGKEVDWVIAKSDHRSTWITKVIMTSPLRGNVWAERLVTTRFLNWFSPSVFGGLDGGGPSYTAHGLAARSWLASGRTDHQARLRILTSFAVLNHPTSILDFIVSGQVKVYREDISHMSEHKIHLRNGTDLKSDAFVASSGWEWRPQFGFQPENIHAEIGIPSKNYSEEDRPLMIAKPMPKSSYPPVAHEERKANPLDILNPKQAHYEPQRLYRCIALPGLAAQGDRSLTFAHPNNISHAIKDELTGLWIYAYFNDKLCIDPERDIGANQVYYTTALY